MLIERVSIKAAGSARCRRRMETVYLDDGDNDDVVESVVVESVVVESAEGRRL